MTTSVRDLCANAQAHEDRQVDPATLSPQQRTILQHLQQRREHGISQFEAQNLYRVAALPRRIADLEEAGVAIDRQRRVDLTGRAYVRYFLG